MLPSLYIKNYRNLKELTINSLSRINLISGKNNTGKTSILEALSLYANKGSIESILQTLTQRGEYLGNSSRDDVEVQNANVKILSYLFNNRKYSFGVEDRIIIGSSDLNDSLSFRFVKYIDREELNESGNSMVRRRTIIEKDDSDNYSIGFESKISGLSVVIPIDRPFTHFSLSSINVAKNQFVRTNSIHKNTNGTLFDNIALTDKEQYLIDALKIIEPQTERIAFIEMGRIRIAVMKLSNSAEIIPLSSMGDGLNRILTIILALVNCTDGYLLIDEFENGLHYTVQDQLWEIVFKLAANLNIQVFATTHSNDCIASFTRILNKVPNKALGQYIRLDNVNGEIKEVSFSPSELDIANNQDIEIR